MMFGQYSKNVFIISYFMMFSEFIEFYKANTLFHITTNKKGVQSTKPTYG